MKKRMMYLTASLIAVTVFAVGCGKTDSAVESSSSVSSVEEKKEETLSSVAEISYANVPFDFSEQIKTEKEAVNLLPEDANLEITVEDENGATGVMLVSSLEEGNSTDYYLNALVSGNELKFMSDEGAEIVSATSSDSGEISVENGSFTVTPAVLNAMNPTDEVISISMEDGTIYNVHTVNEMMPEITITGDGVTEENAGVYSFAVDKFLLRVNTIMYCLM